MRNAPPRPTTYRLRLPGPTAVPERVQQAIAEKLVNHRGPEAHALIAEVETRAKPIFGTANDILLFAGSCTALMEASLANILAPGERVLLALHRPLVERADRVPRFFWDFRKAKAAIDKSETAFTPPLSLIAGLREALRMIDEEGLALVHARHQRLSAALRAGGEALRLTIFTAPSARRSDTV